MSERRSVSRSHFQAASQLLRSAHCAQPHRGQGSSTVHEKATAGLVLAKLRQLLRVAHGGRQPAAEGVHQDWLVRRALALLQQVTLSEQLGNLVSCKHRSCHMESNPENAPLLRELWKQAHTVCTRKRVLQGCRHC